MKNPTTRLAPRGGFSASGNVSSTKARIVPEANIPAQAETDISIASFWKSPRNRREAVQVSIRSYEGHRFADFRVYATDASGRMVPTSRGIGIGLKILPQFAKAAGDALRKAHQLGLMTAVSS